MPLVHLNGIDIDVETHGDRSNPPLILIQGLSCSMLGWHKPLVDKIVAEGFYVVLMDNRGSGKSTKLDHITPPSIGRIILRKLMFLPIRNVPYSLDDMADDVIAVMDHLELPSAHVAGVSMGGMISQVLALNYAHRIKSFSSIMSTTGKRSVSIPKLRIQRLMIKGAGRTRDEIINSMTYLWQSISGQKYPTPLAVQRQLRTEDYERGYSAEGTARQLVAIVASPARDERLASCKVPAQVIHGSDDPLVPVEAGIATARALGVNPVIIKGMGHDLPEALWDTIAELITAHAKQAE